jgi:hypothetical protein
MSKMSKTKSPRKRPPVPVTASVAISQLAEHREKDGDSREGGVFEELYASELRRQSQPQDDFIERDLVAREPRDHSGEQLRAANDDDDSSAKQRAAEQADKADDTSIPPVDLDADRFFAEGESRSSMPHLWGADHEHDDLENEPHPELVRRATPEVLARRAKLRKVTQRVVGAFALIALVGLGKAALSRAPSADLPEVQGSVAHAAAAVPELRAATIAKPSERTPAAEAARAAAIPAPEPVAQPEPVAAAAAEPAAQAVEPAKAEAPVAEAPKPAEAARPAEAAKPVEEVKVAPPGDAKAEKRAAQRAIDRGDNKGAVEAGQRAIEADPTDAEIYLIVGAAYQQMGQNGKAKQVFSSCTHHATHGPKGECAALR